MVYQITLMYFKCLTIFFGSKTHIGKIYPLPIKLKTINITISIGTISWISYSHETLIAACANRYEVTPPKLDVAWGSSLTIVYVNYTSVKMKKKKKKKAR